MRSLMRWTRSTRKRALAVALVGALGCSFAGVTAGEASAAPLTVVRCDTQSLQAGIDAASPGSTLLVMGTCTGTFTIGKNLNVIGVHATLDGAQAGTTLTMTAAAKVRLTGVIITGGSNPNGSGGGINIPAGGTLGIALSRVDGNVANEGGGIFNAGTLHLDHSVVDHNSATGAGGGIQSRGVATVSTSALADNTADTGGGIYAGWPAVDNGTSTTVTRSIISGNTATAGGGGGIGHSYGTLRLIDSRVRDNTAVMGDGGGGILNSGTLVLTRTAVTRNHASHGDTPGAAVGGGIVNYDGAVTLTGSRVAHNVSDDDGGGIVESGGTVVLARTRVYSNNPDNCVPMGSISGCTG